MPVMFCSCDSCLHHLHSHLLFVVTSVIFGLIMKVYYFAFDVNYRRFTTGYELTDPLVFDKSTLGVFVLVGVLPGVMQNFKALCRVVCVCFKSFLLCILLIIHIERNIVWMLWVH